MQVGRIKMHRIFRSVRLSHLVNLNNKIMNVGWVPSEVGFTNKLNEKNKNKKVVSRGGMGKTTHHCPMTWSL